MSIIIKGMDTPATGTSYVVAEGIYGDRYLMQEPNVSGQFFPIFTLPEKHGRAIEAEHLKETLDYYIHEAGWDEKTNQVLGWVKEFIDSEPSIIEAEGE